MPQQPKTNEELQAEVDILRAGSIAKTASTISNNLIRVGGIVWIASIFKDCIVALAGKETVSNLSINANIITTLTANQYFFGIVCLLFGCGGVTYGIAQRELKRKTISHLAQRKEELEQLIDPGRHSSRLTENGTTRPEDR